MQSEIKAFSSQGLLTYSDLSVLNFGHEHSIILLVGV